MAFHKRLSFIHYAHYYEGARWKEGGMIQLVCLHRNKLKLISLILVCQFLVQTDY